MSCAPPVPPVLPVRMAQAQASVERLGFAVRAAEACHWRRCGRGAPCQLPTGHASATTACRRQRHPTAYGIRQHGPCAPGCGRPSPPPSPPPPSPRPWPAPTPPPPRQAPCRPPPIAAARHTARPTHHSRHRWHCRHCRHCRQALLAALLPPLAPALLAPLSRLMEEGVGEWTRARAFGEMGGGDGIPDGPTPQRRSPSVTLEADHARCQRSSSSTRLRSSMRRCLCRSCSRCCSICSRLLMPCNSAALMTARFLRLSSPFASRRQCPRPAACRRHDVIDASSARIAKCVSAIAPRRTRRNGVRRRHVRVAASSRLCRQLMALTRLTRRSVACRRSGPWSARCNDCSRATSAHVATAARSRAHRRQPTNPHTPMRMRRRWRRRVHSRAAARCRWASPHRTQAHRKHRRSPSLLPTCVSLVAIRARLSESSQPYSARVSALRCQCSLRSSADGSRKRVKPSESTPCAADCATAMASQADRAAPTAAEATDSPAAAASAMSAASRRTSFARRRRSRTLWYQN